MIPSLQFFVLFTDCAILCLGARRTAAIYAMRRGKATTPWLALIRLPA